MKEMKRILTALLVTFCNAQKWPDNRMHQGAICGDRFINVGGPPQVVKSPYYPGTFGSQVQCVWKIETDPGSRIKLVFTDFILQLSEGCQISYLEVAEDFENSKLCGKVPTTLITRGNKLTMTLHADMASQKVNQRFKVTLSKTYDRPFIPRGAIDMVAGQKANENIINTYTVKAKNHTPPRAVASRPVIAQKPPMMLGKGKPMAESFGKRPMRIESDYSNHAGPNHAGPNQASHEDWIYEVVEEEEEMTFWDSKLVILFYLVIVALVIGVFLVLLKKLKKADEDDGIADVQT